MKHGTFCATSSKLFLLVDFIFSSRWNYDITRGATNISQRRMAADHQIFPFGKKRSEICIKSDFSLFRDKHVILSFWVEGWTWILGDPEGRLWYWWPVSTQPLFPLDLVPTCERQMWKGAHDDVRSLLHLRLREWIISIGNNDIW